MAPPFKQAQFDLMHDRGISREGDLIDLALEDKLIDKRGAWMNYGEVALGNGKEKAKEFLRENPALVEELTQKILTKRGLLSPAPSNGEALEEPAAPAKPETTGKARRAAVATPSES